MKMKGFRFDVQTLCKIILTGIIITMSGATILLYLISGSKEILFSGIVFTMSAALWNLLLIIIFRMRLTAFVAKLCNILDCMMSGEDVKGLTDSETQFARICHQLERFNQISQKNRYKLDEERRELPDAGVRYFTPGKNSSEQPENGDGDAAGKTCYGTGMHRVFAGNPQPDRQA